MFGLKSAKDMIKRILRKIIFSFKSCVYIKKENEWINFKKYIKIIY